jgi:hypothetical protein
MGRLEEMLGVQVFETSNTRELQKRGNKRRNTYYV